MGGGVSQRDRRGGLPECPAAERQQGASCPEAAFLPCGFGRAVRAAAGGTDLQAALQAAAQTAQAQAEATIPLVAKKGRASYLGERSAGHKDPGAASSALLLQCLAESV